MKILDENFRNLVNVLFATQNGEFDHIYEEEKIKRFKTLCKDKKLIILGTGYYLKALPKYLKIKYGVDVYGVYDWIEEENNGGVLEPCKARDNIDMKRYSKYKDKAKLISKDEFYSDPENTVIFINNDSYANMEQVLYNNGFKHRYFMRNLAKHLLGESIFEKKSTAFDEYDINELNHEFTTPEIARIITLFNLLDDQKSKEVFMGVMKFKLTEDFLYILEIKDDLKLQYLDKEVIQFSDDEVFIDCGGYIGDTIEAFLKVTNGKFKHIYTYEPEKPNYDKLCKYIKSLENGENITPINAGVYYKNDTFYLSGQQTGTICSREISDRKTEVVSISSTIKHAPTFIKMDVQSFETYALLGVMDEIIKYKPKLAICIYHKFDDLWNIPLLLKQWVPEYKLYMRHYQSTQEETVIYALPQ